MTTSATELARELAMLDGVEVHFDLIVKQIVDGERNAATRLIADRPGAQRGDIPRDLALFEARLGEFEKNLRREYSRFVEVYADFRAEMFSVDELLRHVEALRNEKVQAYFSKMRSLQSDSHFVFRQLVERLVRTAVEARETR
jgi:hypothetical protein